MCVCVCVCVWWVGSGWGGLGWVGVGWGEGGSAGVLWVRRGPIKAGVSHRRKEWRPRRHRRVLAAVLAGRG